MKNEQTILLVPFSFSKSSYNALNYAIKSTKDSKAKIILVHAIQHTYSQRSIRNLIATDPDITKRNVGTTLEKLFFQIMKRNEVDCDYELMVELGNPSDVILKAVEKIKPDYIILGQKKLRNKINPPFLNNTFKFPEQTKCQILIITEGVRYKTISKIIFATDYHERDISAIKNLAGLARPKEIKISVLHISDGDLTIDFEEEMLNDFRNKIRQKVKYDNISFQLIEGKNIEMELEKYVDKKNADLFALSSNLHGWLNTLFGKSITAQMLQQTKIPLLLYYFKEEGELLYTNLNTEIYENTF